MNDNKIGHEEIRAIRVANRITSKDFADLMKIPQSSWSSIETGRGMLHEHIRLKAIETLKDLGCDFSILQDKRKIKTLQFDGRMGKEREEQLIRELESIAPVQVEFPKNMFISTKDLPKPKHETEEIINKDQLYCQIADDICKLLQKKDHDYGDSVYNVYKEFGDLSMYMRLSDKMGRLKTVIKGKELLVTDEPLERIYEDIAGYGILALACLIRLRKGE